MENTKYILNFTIDAELLRELGERLVGKPHVALAELIKNSYDADATQVTIKFLPNMDRIEIFDNGHGMSFEEFNNLWMRIGTTHKKNNKHSRNFGRTMTGSKGVGRLAVQFLANILTIKTVPENGEGEWLEAKINWDKTINSKEYLTDVEVSCELKTSDSPFEKGTAVILEGLKHVWNSDSIRDLASEIWWLQPPFSLTSSIDNSDDRFRIRFQSTKQDYEKEFEVQLQAIKKIWIARLVGECVNGNITLSLEFPGEEVKKHKYKIADLPHNYREFDKIRNLNSCRFELRIYYLRGRQKYGIKVEEARKYLSEHGGVHVYDGGFRLPYYGLPESDWLKLEYDHSHRQNMSKLLPENIQQVPRALQNLPTLGRVLGIVSVNTSNEPNLKIMITRDRLAETNAYKDLVRIIRYAIDWYANETAKRKIETKKQETSTQATSEKFKRVEQILEHYESEIPKEIYKEIYNKVHEATTEAKSNQELVIAKMGMLAPLATAGISALSYQHELKKQFTLIEKTINKIEKIRTIDSELQINLNSLSKDLSVWLKRAKSTNLLFDYVADAENIQLSDRRLRAKKVIEEITYQTRFLARGIRIDYNELDEHLLLPKASFAQWGAIFQNVFINAFTAMLDSPECLLHISSSSHDKTYEILIQDTGYGINLNNAEKLFDPFERASEISRERKALGYGGTGLGLTIVRLVTDNIGCRVQFVEPKKGFNTAFSIQWKET